MEHDVEVAVDVPGIVADLATAGTCGFEGMALENPVTHVNGVYVLLDDDVA